MTGEIHWRCFHCGVTFTEAQKRWAAEHFGRREDQEPVCLIRSAGEGALLHALRNAEDQLAGYREEDGDIMRAMCAMSADHAQALRNGEECGYAKGVADARKEHAEIVSTTSVSLPAHYRWGADAMESFDFGVARTRDAILGASL